MESSSILSQPPNKPVYLEEVFHKVRITELSQRGEGITRIQGLVIFVKGTKVGDIVNIIITKVGDRSAEAEVLQ